MRCKESATRQNKTQRFQFPSWVIRCIPYCPLPPPQSVCSYKAKYTKQKGMNFAENMIRPGSSKVPGNTSLNPSAPFTPRHSSGSLQHTVCGAWPLPATLLSANLVFPESFHAGQDRPPTFSGSTIQALLPPGYCVWETVRGVTPAPADCWGPRSGPRRGPHSARTQLEDRSWSWRSQQ